MILIDIEMPEKCGPCPCFHAEFPLYCQLIKPPEKDKRIVAPYGLPRPEWCPLKEQNSCENCAIAIEDRQPVIRCKYCKHSIEWYGDKRRCFLWDENGIGVFEDGFCNYGKRRTDDA